MNLKILPSALADLDHGRRFYARQSSPVGDYFLDSLFSDIDSLELYAGVHAKVFGFHRLLSKRFPYAAYYQIDGDACLVFRVLDCRRDPGKIVDALRRMPTVSPDFMANRGEQKQTERNASAFTTLRGRATVRMSSDEIMALTRGA